MRQNELGRDSDKDKSFTPGIRPPYSDGPIALGYIPDVTENERTSADGQETLDEHDASSHWRLQYDMYMCLHRDKMVRAAEIGLAGSAIVHTLVGTTVTERIGSIVLAGAASFSFGAHLVDKYHHRGPGATNHETNDA